MYDDSYSKLVGVDKYKEKIDEWIKTRKHNALLITGPSGSGKTHFVTQYLKYNNYNTLVYNSSNFKKPNMLHGLLYKVYQHDNILKLENKSFKQAIVFDEIEGISINDKGCIAEIINFVKKLNKYRYNLTKGKPVKEHFDLDVIMICIGQDSYIKKLKQLKSVCTPLSITPPSISNLSKILSRECPDIPKTKHDEFIQYINGDFRKLKSILLTKETHTMNLKWYNLYNITERILYHNEDIASIIRHYYNQKILLHLMIHENYKNAIINQSTKISKHIAHIAHLISNSDCIGTYIFNLNEWDLGLYYILASCYHTSKYINSVADKTKNITYKSAIWPKLLNRTSLHCTYKHTYDTLTATFNDYYTDRSTVRFNLAKIRKLLQKDKDKYKYLLDVYKFEDMKELDKVFKTI